MSKEDDLLAGALTVFAREGYSRSSITTIAAEAKVSTRTIYNQYSGKAALFHAVMLHSTRVVADHHLALVREATAGRPLHEAVMELADRFAGLDPRFQQHHALIRQVQAERDHIPQATLDAWVTLGPLRVRAVLEDELRRLFSEVDIRLGDPSAAADTLMLLIGGDPIRRGFYREHPYTGGYLVRLARNGARVFLAAYTESSLVPAS